MAAATADPRDGFVIGRAAAAGMSERSPETWRWLVYLPLGAMYLLVAAGHRRLAVAAGRGRDDGRSRCRRTPWHIVRGARPGSRDPLGNRRVGVWWVVLGVVLLRAWRGVRWLLMPFADGFGRPHARRLAVAGVLLAAGSAAVLVWLSRFWERTSIIKAS